MLMSVFSGNALYATVLARPAVVTSTVEADLMRPASAPWSTLVHQVP